MDVLPDTSTLCQGVLERVVASGVTGRVAGRGRVEAGLRTGERKTGPRGSSGSAVPGIPNPEGRLGTPHIPRGPRTLEHWPLHSRLSNHLLGRPSRALDGILTEGSPRGCVSAAPLASGRPFKCSPERIRISAQTFGNIGTWISCLPADRSPS